MALQHLQHFLIQTADLSATTRWYVDVLGLREGPHPEFKIPTVWLYIGDTDVLHLIEGGPDQSENRMRYLGQQSEAVHGSGVVDHVAFRAAGLKDMLADLRAKGVAFKTRQVDHAALFQVFLIDPNGVKIELNFEKEEAKGVTPELMASDLPG